MPPTERIVVMRPKDAAELLTRLDERQRAFSRDSLLRLKMMVATWGWHPWLTRIVITTEGTVLDGQHTLVFISQQLPGSQWPVRVVYGVDPEMVEVIRTYAVGDQ